MTADPKLLVACSYDQVAVTYLERFGRSQVRERWLDLGCGAGVPVMHELTRRGFDVVGVDGSSRQIELAHHKVPRAELIHVDMTNIDFDHASFDGISAFYSITHVPREEHPILFRRVASWLKHGGVFVATLGSRQCPNWKGKWLGVDMYFSHYDVEMNMRLVRNAGLAIENSEVVHEDNDDEQFLWVVARRC